MNISRYRAILTVVELGSISCAAEGDRLDAPWPCPRRTGAPTHMAAAWLLG